MKLTQIRNATLKLEYGGSIFLLDPMLAERETLPGFPGTARSHLRNPLVSLPMATEEIVNVDAVIVTHTHADHWDEAAQRQIARHIPLYSQNAGDAAIIRSQGFTDVHVLAERNKLGNITLWKSGGQHGSDAAYAQKPLAGRLGEACGLVFQHPDEPTLYVAGDTVWVPAVEKTLQRFTPHVVVLNAGQAEIEGFGAIIMGKEDVLRTHRVLPHARIVASHMEAISHCLLSRRQLRDYAADKGISSFLDVPEDGESLTFTRT